MDDTTTAGNAGRPLRALAPALLTSLLAASSAAQTHAPSDPGALHVPRRSFVPLSQFAEAQAGVTEILEVRRDILDWLVAGGHRILVSVSTTGGIQEAVPDAVDMQAGTVTYTPSVDADVVVVSGAFKNAEAIHTHFDRSLNGSRGGQSPGATEGIYAIEYDAMKEGLEVAKGGNDIHTGSGSAHVDANGNQYHFATDTWALFSDGTESSGTGTADLLVPGYEHYIAENWSLHAIPALAAVAFSDQVREATGLPVRHINAEDAFDPGAPAVLQVSEGIPILQVLHASIVEVDDPNVVGSESSLATFLLPPGWVAAPNDPYPVLMNSFYDLHANTFMVSGPAFLERIGGMATDPSDPLAVVGVLMNGGGAAATVTRQESIYVATDTLFDEIELSLGVDRDGVVITGGSRGGTAALGLASHPDSGFTAQYVVAGSPTLFGGETIRDFSNPTYALVHRAVASHAGYRDGWQEGLMPAQPGNKDCEQLAAQVIYGTDDFVAIDTGTTKPSGYALGNGSPYMVGGLAAKGSRLVLLTGTHDTARPFVHGARYYLAALDVGVPILWEVGYRFGHGSAGAASPGLEEMLRSTASGNHAAFDSRVAHVHPLTPADEHGLVGTEFDPPLLDRNDPDSTLLVPMVLEMPAFCGVLQEHTYTVSGPPGAAYQVWATQLDGVAFDACQVVETGSPMLLFSGTLDAGADPDGQFASDVITLPGAPVGIGGNQVWRLRLFYDDGSGPAQAIVETAPPVGGGTCSLPNQLDLVAATQWRFGDTDMKGYTKYSSNRGQGLSTDIVDN